MDKIQKILSGITIIRINGLKIYVRPFTPVSKLEASIFADEILEDNIYFAMSNEEAEKLAGWTKEDEKKLKEVEEKIEQGKVDYFLNFAVEARRKHIKYNIGIFKDEYKSLLSRKLEFNDKTSDYLKEYARISFLIEENSFIDNQIPVKGRVDSIKLVSRYLDSNLHDDDIRSIAKSIEWRMIWSSSKASKGVFGSPSSELTNEQLSLLSWSKFYDSIGESADPPTDEVVEDDTALDGWLILQGRKRKEDSKRKEAEKLLPKNNQNAGELFIIGKSKEEMDQIMSLNDGYGKHAINSLKNDLNQKGEVRESDLTRVRQEIQMEINKR